MNANPPPPKPPTSNPLESRSQRLAPFWKRTSDQISRSGDDESFDAIADLFLGEAEPTPAKSKAPITPTPSPSAAGPALRLTREDESKSEPASPAPKPAIRLVSEDDEPVDAFGEAKPVDILPPAARTPVLECVVLANLPVLASAWASQYTREIAQVLGKPIAVVRVQGGFISVDVVGLPASITLPGHDEIASLDDAIDIAAEVTDRWIVRCDAGSESLVAKSPITRAITVLSGTDQAAAAACKSTLEHLAGVLGDSVRDEDAPMIRIAMMGTTPEQAQQIGPQLSHAASMAIGRNVPAIGCTGQINASRPAHALFSGPSGTTIDTVVRSIERALVADDVFAMPMQAASAAPEQRTEIPAPAATEPEIKPAAAQEVVPAVTIVGSGEPVVLRFIETEPLDVPAAKTVEPIKSRVAEGSPTLRPAAAKPFSLVPEPVAMFESAPASVSEVQPVAAPVSIPLPTPASTPAPALAPVARPRRTAREPVLVGHLPDLKPLDIRCPYAEQIELATDSSGTLHLLAQATGPAAEESTLAALLVASSWAEAHAAIVANTGTHVAAHRRPAMHLFTDQPKRTRRLLETNLRVHLLAPVQAGTETVWFCTELN